MSFWASIMLAPRTAVSMPTTKATWRVVELKPIQRGQAVDQKPAGIDDAGMQQGMHRRRRIKRTGQPDVQRKLGGLAHGSNEKQQGDGRRAADLEARQGREGGCGFAALAKSLGIRACHTGNGRARSRQRKATSPTRKRVKVRKAPSSVAACAWLCARR